MSNIWRGAGNTPDLTGPVIARALCHTDNAYFIPNGHFVGHACKTNTVSNTAFRGFGGPQGIIAIEAIIDTIARETGHRPQCICAASTITARRPAT